jgi:hypothetical protein
VKRLLPVAALSLVVLSGCAHNPQVAATVAGHDISTHDVDVLTHALCLEQQGSGQSQPTTIAALQASALSALISTKVDEDYAAKNDLSDNPPTLASSLKQLDGLIAKVPSKDRKLASSLITELIRGQLQVQEVVIAKLQQSGQKLTQTLVTQGIQQLEQQHASTLTTTVNPRYDTGTTKDADGASVSKAVSTSATSALSVLRGNSSKTDTAYVASLPSSQRCG